MPQDYFEDNPQMLEDVEDVMSIRFPLRTSEDSEDRLFTENFPRTEMQINRSEPLIRIAMPNDATAIEALAQRVSLKRIDLVPPDKDESPHKMGFLVSGFDARVYAQFVKIAEHFLVLHEGGELVGFLLAYGSENINDPKKEELNMHIKQNICPTKFVLIKQICISPKIQHRRKGYASLLYKELYARVTHYYNDEAGPRPIYTAIVKEPANPVSVAFHEKLGFTERQTYTPEDGTPRYIFENSNLMRVLDQLTTEETRSEKCPFYDSRAMMDPHCIGIGATMYSIEPPDTLGNFECNVRIMMKWRQLNITKVYKREDDGLARTTIDLEKHEKEDPRTLVRLPRYDLNKHDVDQISSYAYIDKNDPQDVITWQQVLRGTFQGELRNLIKFPADLQELKLAFRMWDNDPDDRCRYFRQLHYADNTAWPLCIKRKIKSLSFAFLAPQAEVDVFKTSQTSRYTLTIPVLRETSYYLRTVALPMVLITSLSFSSYNIEEFGDRVGFNSSILLTTVAYLFITKDVTPDTSEVTMLDIITYSALVLSWSLIMIHFFATLEISSQSFKDTKQDITLGLCFFATGLQCSILIFLFVRYQFYIRSSRQLGDIN